MEKCTYICVCVIQPCSEGVKGICAGSLLLSDVFGVTHAYIDSCKEGFLCRCNIVLYKRKHALRKVGATYCELCVLATAMAFVPEAESGTRLL